MALIEFVPVFRNNFMQKQYERKIMNSFPYPIASRFTRLRTKQCRNAGYDRLSHIFGTAEVITRYLAIIVISECHKYLEKNDKLEGVTPPTFAEHIKRPSWGHWLGFIRNGLKWLHQQQVELTMPELHDFWFNTRQKPTMAANALNSLISIRNRKSAHNLKGLRENEYEPLCAETWENLSLVLEALSFLSDYELRFIHKIEVNNVRRRPTTFIHEYSSGIGCMDDFEADDECKSKFMESESTLLLSPKTHRYLNLEPLMIYENTSGKAPDIFFYEGMDKPEKAHYSACKHGGKFSLNDSDTNTKGRQRRERVAEELQYLLDLFSPSNPILNSIEVIT